MYRTNGIYKFNIFNKIFCAFTFNKCFKSHLRNTDLEKFLETFPVNLTFEENRINKLIFINSETK